MVMPGFLIMCDYSVIGLIIMKGEAGIKRMDGSIEPYKIMLDPTLPLIPLSHHKGRMN